jgi:2-oxoglutarate dehydrogenase complex dehydrogenase (E1) component-like enzyme
MAKRWPRQVTGKKCSIEQINAFKTIVEVQNIFYAYRRFGHFHANIDPLGMPLFLFLLKY